VSILLLVYRASRPNIAELGKVPGTADQYADRARHPANELVADVAILRVESGLFFANAEEVRRAVLQRARQPGTRAVILDAETIGAVDVTAVRALVQLAGELERSGVHLALAHGIGQVRDMLRQDRERGDPTLELYPTVQAAVDALTPDP